MYIYIKYIYIIIVIIQDLAHFSMEILSYGEGLMASRCSRRCRKNQPGINQVYPLVNIQKTMENHHF
jgi:hypothetical protein